MFHFKGLLTSIPHIEGYEKCTTKLRTLVEITSLKSRSTYRMVMKCDKLYTWLEFQANFFDRNDVAFHHIAEYFKNESKEERKHAEMMMEYHNKRGGTTAFSEIRVWYECLYSSNSCQCLTISFHFLGSSTVEHDQLQYPQSNAGCVGARRDRLQKPAEASWYSW